jgi:hypothetical protein
LPSHRIGIEIVIVESPQLTLSGFVSARTANHLINAQLLLKTDELNEMVVIFVTPHRGVAAQIDDWFADDDFGGPGISVIVAVIDALGLHIVRNQTSHPMLLSAFAVDGTTTS